MRRFQHVSTVLCLQLAALSPLLAGPTLIPTAEGQLGEPLNSVDEVVGSRVESIRGELGSVLIGDYFLRGGAPIPPPELRFLTDRIHADQDAVPVGTLLIDLDPNFKTPPASARSRNRLDDGDFVAFSFTEGGSMPNTLGIQVPIFDEDGSLLTSVTLDNIPTFPDPTFAHTGIAVDDQGRVTVVYSDLPGPTPTVRAVRYDGLTGQAIGAPIEVGPGLSPDVVLLDPEGNRLVIPSTTFAAISANLVDISGPTPVVMPAFPVSTTDGDVNSAPAIAADAATGTFFAVWENFVDLQGDPVNVRGRRFDADGNPVGDDFLVNQTTANAQAQPAVAYGTGGLSAVVWAGDAEDTVVDKLDVFLQVYNAQGLPIGGELRVNSFTQDIQDRPTVRFLPEPDGQGRPRLVVVWRDVANPAGTEPRGTGTSYRCFSIGAPDTPFFEDGFESGDTTAW